MQEGSPGGTATAGPGPGVRSLTTSQEMDTADDFAGFDFHEHVERIAEHGWTLVTGALSPAHVAEARDALLTIAVAERERPSACGLHNLYNRGEAFERVYTTPGGRAVLQLARHFLGDDATLADIEGRVSHVPATAQPPGGLHVDGSLTGPFQANAAADTTGRLISHMLTLRAIWCLTEFSEHHGTTRVVDKSHRNPKLPPGGPHGSPSALPGTRYTEANPGDVLLYSSATYHSYSPPSPSAPHPRVALLSGYSRSWIFKGFAGASTAAPHPEALPRPDVIQRAGDLAAPLFGLQAAVHPSARGMELPRPPPPHEASSSSVAERASEAEMARHLMELETVGLTLVHHAIPPELLQRLRVAFDRAVANVQTSKPQEEWSSESDEPGVVDFFRASER
jgi:hypothetical protein